MGTDDPHSPHYQPPLGGGRVVGDVGSGDDFGADTFRLYLAGRVFIPETANLYSRSTDDLLRLGTYARALAPKHPSFQRIDAIVEGLHHALYRTSTSLQATGEALVQVVDDFVRTDAEARDQFIRNLKDARSLEPGENSVPALSPQGLPLDYTPPTNSSSYGYEEERTPRRGGAF